MKLRLHLNEGGVHVEVPAGYPEIALSRTVGLRRRCGIYEQVRSEHLGFALSSTVGLRPSDQAGGIQGIGFLAWNRPEQYGRIATRSVLPGQRRSRWTWNCPEQYRGIATRVHGRLPRGCGCCTWNCPEQYGGMATRGWLSRSFGSWRTPWNLLSSTGGIATRATTWLDYQATTLELP